MNHRRGSGTRPLAEMRRVLIVDDNHDSAELLSLVLEREGHETRIAHDPREAIPLALQFCPSLAFLDIGLPGMDGFALLRILRVAPELIDCKFVAVTGYEELRGVPDSQGFDAHLTKPVDLGEVVRLALDLGRADLATYTKLSAGRC